jgi:spermidine synthase
MSKDNPFALVVNVENAKCVVEFDVIGDSEINYETWEVFYNKNFKGNLKQALNPDTWVLVTDLIHDKTWESIEDQIKAQWKDVEEQQRGYDEHY